MEPSSSGQSSRKNTSLNEEMLFVDEDHFSIHSDIDLLEDIDNKSVGV